MLTEEQVRQIAYEVVEQELGRPGTGLAAAWRVWEAIEALTIAQQRTEEEVRALAEAQRRTEERVEELAEAQRRTEERVEELAAAQCRTEERLARLEAAVQELVTIVQRHEERLASVEERLARLEATVQELVEIVRRHEERLASVEERLASVEERLASVEERVARLEDTVAKLAEAQRRTEQRLEELAEAQKRTEERVEALARRMEELTGRVEELADRLGETNRQLGGLAATVGYTLENAAYRALPGLLARDHGVRLVEGLRRDFVVDAGGQAWEVNILGRAEVSGQVVWVVGESKVQLSRNDVDRFVRRRLERLEPVLGRVLPVLVAHMVSEPGVREYARSQGVSVYLSYEFES